MLKDSRPTLPVMGRLTLLSIACLTIMVGAAIAPALDNVARALGVSQVASWLITLPSLGAVVFAPFAGRIIDRIGAYTALNMGLLSYGILGLLGIISHGLVGVFVDRILLGGATALTMAGGTTLISQWYQGRSRLKMIALQGMAIELGGVIFLFVSGQLALVDWRLPFLIYALAFICWLMLLFTVPSQAPASTEADISDPQVQPVSYSLRRVYLVAMLSMIIFFTAIVTLPISLKQQGFTEDKIGFLLAFISIVAVLTASQMPRVIGKLGERPTLMFALLIYSASHWAFFISANNLALLIAGAVLSGIAFGLSIPLVNHMTIEGSHRQVRGRNLSYLTMAIFLGQFLTSFLDFLPVAKGELFSFTAILALIFAIIFFVDYQLRRGSTKASH